MCPADRFSKEQVNGSLKGGQFLYLNGPEGLREEQGEEARGAGRTETADLAGGAERHLDRGSSWPRRSRGCPPCRSASS